ARGRRSAGAPLSPAPPFAKLRQQTVEMMHAVFTLDAKAPAIVIPRTQAALHALTDGDVFLLYFVGEVNGGLLHAGVAVGEPLENGKGTLGADRQNDVGAQVVGIDVEHIIGEDPVVERFIGGVGKLVAARLAGVARANGRDLRRIVAERIDAVLRVVELAEEARVRGGQVIALEVVIDIHLPVALDGVVAAVGEVEPIYGAAHLRDFGGGGRPRRGGGRGR